MRKGGNRKSKELGREATWKSKVTKRNKGSLPVEDVFCLVKNTRTPSTGSSLYLDTEVQKRRS
jgi:hypothetical protein